jgi:heme/copper-type cytochrome/quinol oxidase subunit 4
MRFLHDKKGSLSGWLLSAIIVVILVIVLIVVLRFLFNLF